MSWWKTDDVTWRALRPVVRELRYNSNEAEQTFWAMVRARRFRDLKFRRQHVVGQFIVDFYCPPARVAVEIDGGIHRQSRAQDSERDRYLNSCGIDVIRFSDRQILCEIESVVAALWRVIEPRL